MSNPEPTVDQLAGRMFEAVKLYVDERLAALSRSVDALSNQVKALPAARDGKDGRDGADGKDGTSVTPQDLVPLLEEAIDARKEDLQRMVDSAFAAMPTPSDGRDGTDGKDGKDGRDGVDGKSVELDDVRSLVAEAVKAIRAPADGRDGLRGEPGRDALALDVLPGIDVERVYPRGSFAKHANGLWRAFRQTKGMEGWECIVAGVAGVEYEASEDERELTVKLVLSDGNRTAHTLRLMTTLYKGVYREGEDYDVGHLVTWAGSLWHCKAPTKDKPSDGAGSWQLAAKRGRDGRDGRDGVDKTQAVKL